MTMLQVSDKLIDVSVQSWIANDNQSRAERGLAVNGFKIVDRSLIGSHSLGYASPQSDIDIHVIYKHNVEVYLSPIADPQHQHPAVYKTERIDVHGTDLRTFLGHIYAHKLSAWNYMRAMDVKSPFATEILGMAKQTMSANQLVRGYYHYAHSMMLDGKENAGSNSMRALGRNISGINAILLSWCYRYYPARASTKRLIDMAQFFDDMMVEDPNKYITPIVRRAIDLRTGADTDLSVDKMLVETSAAYITVLEKVPDGSTIKKDLQHCPKRLAVLREFSYLMLMRGG